MWCHVFVSCRNFRERNGTTFSGKRGCILSGNFEGDRHYTIAMLSTEMRVLKYVFTQ